MTTLIAETGAAAVLAEHDLAERVEVEKERIRPQARPGKTVALHRGGGLIRPSVGDNGAAPHIPTVPAPTARTVVGPKVGDGSGVALVAVGVVRVVFVVVVVLFVIASLPRAAVLRHGEALAGQSVAPTRCLEANDVRKVFDRIAVLVDVDPIINAGRIGEGSDRAGAGSGGDRDHGTPWGR